MMRALKAGGIEPLFNPGREAAMQAHRASPGYYELRIEDLTNTQFMRDEMVDGMAVKVPTPYLRNLPPVPTRLIWLHRDPAEIMASLRRMYPTENFNRIYSPWPEGYHETTKAMRELIDDRKSACVVDVQYAEMVAAPMRTMVSLGICLDVSAAVAALTQLKAVA